MPTPRDPGDAPNDGQDRPVVWLAGLLPYHPDGYRALISLLVAGALMGASVRALMPEIRSWPIEQFHLRDRLRRQTAAPVQVPPVDLSRFQPAAAAAPPAPLPRQEGARLVFPREGLLPIRVLPTATFAPTVEPLQQGVSNLPQVPGEVAPEMAERALRRAYPNRQGAPLALGAGGRTLRGSSERGPGSAGLQRAPIIGARHEYPNLETQEVVGSRTIPPTSARSGGDAEGTSGRGSFPPRERRITAIRLVPEVQQLEAGMSEDYDLQVELDHREWFSVTHWPEASFRLLSTGSGVEQHRQADNVFSCLLGTSPTLDGAQVMVEGILQLPGGRPLIARAIIIVRSDASAQSVERRPPAGSKLRTGE